MSCPNWAANMRATTANVFSRLSDKLSRFACGLSPLATALDDDEARAGLGSALLVFLGGDNELSLASSSRFAEDPEEPAVEDGETTLPCVAFPSQHGFMVFSLADDCMRDGVQLRPATGRRLVPSPYGGAVLATDLFFRHSSRLVDPLTGQSAPLPDLPVPLGDTEPTPCAPEEPRVRGRRRAPEATDDGFAWDRCPRGVMIARGDTVFFCERGGGSWTPLRRSTRGSRMTVNYRGGFFFVLEERSLLTVVIDAWTLDEVAVIAPPPCDDAIDRAYLVASTDDVLLLVHRAKDMDRELFSHMYRARNKRPRPEWSKVSDIGDRVLFVDRLHGFSVGTGGENTAVVRRNCIYWIKAAPVEDARGSRVAVYKVVEFHLKRPEVGETLECMLGGFQVEQMWGEPYWMIPKRGALSIGN